MDSTDRDAVERPTSIPDPASWNALGQLEAIATEAFDRWDKDMRSGKLMLALTGDLPRYRADVSSVRLACAVAPGLLSTVLAINIFASRKGAFAGMDAEALLQHIRDFTSKDDLARYFSEAIPPKESSHD